MNQPAKPTILTCQIIAGALMMGVVMFAGFTLANHVSNPPEQPGNDPTMLIIAVVFTLVDLMARFFYLKSFDRNMTGKIADREAEGLVPEDILGAFQTRLIVSLALLEGVAFFCLIVFMIDGRWEAFGITVFLLLMMAASFPTDNKFRSWVRKVTGKSAFAGDE